MEEKIKENPRHRHGEESEDPLPYVDRRVPWPSLSSEPKCLEPQSTPLDELSFHLAWWKARSLQGGMTALRARPPSACSGE